LAGFVRREHVAADGSKHGFIVFIPYQYDPAKRSPMILFLHGGGERGDNNVEQVLVGLAPAIMKNRGKFPFVTVFPQCEREKNWKAGGTPADLALAMLKQTQAEFKTDPNRVYMTGLSMGGQGSWTIAAQHPHLFAAIVPMCAAPDLELAAKIANARIPSWNFCGEKDAPATLQANREMAAALKKIGAPHQYTEIPDAGHNCWDAAYGNPALFAWMLENSRSTKTQP
ncbi:MAG: prolyl oligopeptidase family serine peptidase, partial [Planctomycetales bacterium]|nr:prolyl oligopeptidase family serine peptidase [Planctomycetales bacterium]